MSGVTIVRDNWYGPESGIAFSRRYDAKVYRAKHCGGTEPSCEYGNFTLSELLVELEPYSDLGKHSDRGEVVRIVIERRES